MTVTGRTLGEEIERSGPGFAQDVVRSAANPIYPQGGIAVLQGNLAPGGAIIKQSAADPALMEHEGRAVVFENAQDLLERIDSPELDVTADDILVLKNIGPKGAPGMPEAGYIPIPLKLARSGVKDIVRISDGRMSGTAFGTIVLHVTPESAVGGPLAHVRNGDRIRLSVRNREIALLISDEELAERARRQPVAGAERRTWLPKALPADGDAGRPGCRLRLHARSRDDGKSAAHALNGRRARVSGPARASSVVPGRRRTAFRCARRRPRDPAALPSRMRARHRSNRWPT